MRTILVAGTGKIGSLIACLLAYSGDYQVHLADIDFAGSDVSRVLASTSNIKTVLMDVTDEKSTEKYIKKQGIQAVISSLPYFLNIHVARAAKAALVHYFDLTEDIDVTKEIKKIALGAETAFVPQCGLAPGLISIIANSLINDFDPCFFAKLRVGALPQRVNNALHYSLTWSTDGVINEYGNTCYAIENGEAVMLKPLEGLESIQLDGCEYEAFNTSGGLGSLAELYQGQASSLNYKTIRYPGHCEKMRLLMNELKLNEDRGTLKYILERAIPKTYQDMVIVYVAVEGMIKGVFSEKSYYKKIYPEEIHSLQWSAIQISTASGLCSIVDLVMNKSKAYKGFVLQESFSLEEVLSNRFGKHYIQEE
jgi:saccharopine dehydrogenase-like NADP-dependent oxidoreductase